MRISVIAYDRISPFMLSTPLAVFGEPFLNSDFQVEVCAANQVLAASSGLDVLAHGQLADARFADVVVLPGWRDHTEPLPSKIIEELQEAHEKGAIVVGLCLGAFGLAQAGLLDDKRATTHWARRDAFAERFPRVTVDPGAIFVDEGQVVTSAGIASGLDCCLHLLSRLSGTGEANRIARHLVVAPLRLGAQPQLIERTAPQSSVDHRLEALLDAIRVDPTFSPTLDQLADRAGMSRRSLTRHIRSRTGGSLGDWLRRQRLARAQELLCSGSRGLSEVAAQSGFPDDHALRSAFKVELGMTPRQWLARQRVD